MRNDDSGAAAPGTHPIERRGCFFISPEEAKDRPRGNESPGKRAPSQIFPFLERFALTLDYLANRPHFDDELSRKRGASDEEVSKLGRAKVVDFHELRILIIRSNHAKLQFFDLPAALFERASLTDLVIINGRVVKNLDGAAVSNPEEEPTHA